MPGFMHSNLGRRMVEGVSKMQKAGRQFKEMLDARAQARGERKAEQQNIVQKRIHGFNLKFRNQRQRYEFFAELNEGTIPRMIFGRVSPNGILELVKLGHGPLLIELLQKYFHGEANDNEINKLNWLFRVAKQAGKRLGDDRLKGNEIGKRRMKIQIARVQSELQQMMQMRGAA